MVRGMRALLILLCGVALALAGEPPALRWLPAENGTGGPQQAVLVIADQYPVADWNLPTLANNRLAMRRGLVEAGWSNSSLRELYGSNVSRERIKTNIIQAAAALSGPDPLLLLYYSGHGFTAPDGTPELYTSDTQELPGGQLAATIKITELIGWINEALTDSGKPQAGSVLVIDACRKQGILGTPPQAVLRPMAVWQIFSTDTGLYAKAPPTDGPSEFTGALAAALAKLAADDQEAGSKLVFDQLMSDLQRRGASPLPKLLPPAAGASDPPLRRRPQSIPCRLAVEAGSGTLLRGAQLLVDGQPQAGAELRILPGRRRLQILAPGYRSLEQEFTVPNEPGGVLSASLKPWLQLKKESLGRPCGELEIDGLTLRFRRIPAGTYLRGSPPGEAGRNARSEGQLSAPAGPAWIAETETTQKLWNLVMGTNPSHAKGDDRPVDSLSWFDAQAFLEALGRRCPGLAPRLPSEAEWEVACRAGSEDPWCFGARQDLLQRYANFADRRLFESDPDPDRWLGVDRVSDDGVAALSAPVARYQPNAWGLYDMHGNVAEWCQDAFSPDPGKLQAGATPPRALRGGSWMSPPYLTRSAARLGLQPATATPATGFRLVVSSSPTGP